jgi:hypothetical protein
MPVILVTWEAKSRSITVLKPAQACSLSDSILKETQHKREVLNSKPSTAKNKETKTPVKCLYRLMKIYFLKINYNL